MKALIGLSIAGIAALCGCLFLSLMIAALTLDTCYSCKN